MHTVRAATLAGVAAAALGGLLIAGQLVPNAGFSSSSPDGPSGAPLGSATRVAVLIVHDKNLLRELREAIAKDRVVAEGERAFALGEGRIVALSAADAGPLIGALDWTDRSVELIDTATLGGRDPRHLRATSTPGGHGDLAWLSKKKTFSLGEAIRYLNSQP